MVHSDKKKKQHILAHVSLITGSVASILENKTCRYSPTIIGGKKEINRGPSKNYC